MKATATQTNTFIYDAWNMVQESTVSGLQSHVSHFVWGLDLSGTLQGAGGVGGLLMVVKGRANPPGEPLFPSCDANGNVTDLVDTNGAVVAHYEYDPYGNTIAQSGPQADANHFRFSSKYWDEESGSYYYGYRFYNPELGRWVSRDPIEERGGLNIYAFGINDPPNIVDNKGRMGIPHPYPKVGVPGFVGGGKTICDPGVPKGTKMRIVIDKRNISCTKICTEKHEDEHANDQHFNDCCDAYREAWQAAKTGPIPNSEQMRLSGLWNSWFQKRDGNDQPHIGCKAYQASLDCAKQLDPGDDCQCKKDIYNYSKQAEDYLSKNCPAGDVPACPF